MEENRKITLNLGEVSWEEQLGNYYIDMRPARIHYEDGTYRTKFDGKGVPMIPTQDGYKYFPINIAQYGFMLLADYAESNDPKTKTTLESLTEVLIDVSNEEDGTIIWWHDYDCLRYGIPAPWASAMAQGEVISFLLRMYQINNDSNLLHIAQKAAKFLLDEKHPKKVAVRDENNFLWLEEYPSTPSSYVLNGFIYAVFGLVDLYRVTKDKSIKKGLDECLVTLTKNMHRFDAGYWSYYDLLKKELVRYYYQKNVHVPQLDVLFQLTQDPVHQKYAEKWKKQIHPINFAFVQLMYRVLPRWRKLFK